MNTRTIITLLAGLGTLTLVGCSPKDDTPPTPAATSTNSTVDRMTTATRDAAEKTGDTLASAWDSVKDATYSDRQKIQASLSNLSSSVDAKIDQLQARSASATDATKESLNRGVQELRDAQVVLKEKISKLGDATADTWDRAKADVATAWERVRRSYSELESQPTTS